jgi:hypothetical protein
MTTMKKSIVILAFALELAVAATATAAAKSRTVHPGHQARAQAIEDVMEGGVSVSPERVRALHECNARIAGYKGYNQMSMPIYTYRSCMHEHGQAE